jgi:hypothetical protein
MRNACTVSARDSEGKRQLERPKYRWEIKNRS